jgi:hypothetical protein
MTEPVYSRAPDVVWRLGPDRVLVRRIGATGEGAAAEMHGVAAHVWLLLDTPTGESALRTVIPDSAVDAVDQPVTACWVVSNRASSPPMSQ